MKVLGHHLYLPIVLMASAEFGVAMMAFAVSVLIAHSVDVGEGALSEGLLLPGAFGFGVAVVVGMTAVGLYQAKQRLRLAGVVARIIVGLGLAAIGLALVAFVFQFELGGPLWIGSFGLSAVLLSVTRATVWRWLDHDAFQRRVLVYGAGKRAASLLKLRRRSDRRGFSIAAFLPAEGDEHVIEDRQVTLLTGTLLEYAKTHDIDEIVVAMDDRRQGFPVSDLLSCKFSGIVVVDLLTFLERETGKVNVDLVNPSWLIFSEEFERRSRLRIVTRMTDFFAALALLIVASPAMAVVAAVIAIDDGLPVLYRQSRVGLMGKTFTLYKFRSMVRNAEADGDAQWAKAGDSRATRVGKVLRKLRLDELPQLFNVILGDMSLVGPRPERPEFVESLSRQIPYYQERHIVKPGITGWAQLSYPYGASEHDAMEKLKYDLYYIKHKSLIFDLMVLLQTAEVVLWRKGAR